MSKGASMSTVESSSVNKGATPAGAKHQVSFARLAFERLGMLPVLVVMYALFYGLTIYFSDDEHVRQCLIISCFNRSQ